jgi:drug/metabolite transporter (DMT)-like permease
VSRRGWLLFAAMSVIWGIPYLLIKVAVGGVAPPVLVLARVSIGAAILLPLAVRRRELAVLRPHWRWLALFALVEIITPWLLLTEAETRLPSSLSGLLVAAVPIIVAVLARFTGSRDRMSAIRWAGLLVGLGGVALLLGPGAPRGATGSVFEVLGVAVCYAIGPLVASRKLSELPSLGITAVCLAFAAVVYAPLAALTWPSSVPAAKVFWSIGGLAVICTAVAFICFFALIAEAGPARATVITYVNPAVAVVLGALVLNERISSVMVGAFALILGGSVLATRGGRRQAVAEDARRAGLADPRPQPARPEAAPAVRPAGGHRLNAAPAGLTPPGDVPAGQEVPSCCN